MKTTSMILFCCRKSFKNIVTSTGDWGGTEGLSVAKRRERVVLYCVSVS
jgi:hypothetical protein